jgi:ferredoxin
MDSRPIKKLPNNSPGRFYTTDCCILCDACVNIAPTLFKPIYENKLLMYYIVSKQPETKNEFEQMMDAYQVTFGENGPGPCIIDSEDRENTPKELVVD